MGRIKVNLVEVNIDPNFLERNFPFASPLRRLSEMDVFIPPSHLTDPPEPPIKIKIERAVESFVDRIKQEPHSPHELVIQPYQLIASYTPPQSIDDGVKGSPFSVNLRLDLDEFSPLWEGERMAEVLIRITLQVRGNISQLAQGTEGTEPLFHIRYSPAVITYLEEQVDKRWIDFEKFWQSTEELLKVEGGDPTETIRAHTRALNDLRGALDRLALFIQEGLGLTRGITAEHASNWDDLFSLFHDCSNILTSHSLALDLTEENIEESKRGGYKRMHLKDKIGLLVQETCKQQMAHYSEKRPHYQVAIASGLDHLTLTSVDQRFALRRIFTNLVVNALRNSKPDVVSVMRVRSGFISYQDQPHLAVVVEDEGTGMNADFIKEKLGIPGQRKGAYSGDGQGISGSLRLLDQLGGHLRVASTDGTGSAFAMVIPTSGLEFGVVNGVGLEEYIKSSSLSLEGINHTCLFDDENRVVSRAASNLFIMETKPKINWKKEFFGNVVSDAPFEILYFALPQKVRDFVPEEAHILFSVGAMRVLQFLPFMPKTSVVSLKGMASFMLPMALASLGWDLVGQASGVETLEQEQLANNLFMSVTGTAIQYGVHRAGMAKALPYFGYALGADILLGGVFSLAALALEQIGGGHLATYRLNRLAWERVIANRVGLVPLIGGALAMVTGVFSNASYSLGYLLALGEQMMDPHDRNSLLREVDQLKVTMSEEANSVAQKIIEDSHGSSRHIEQALWKRRHDATLDTRSFYIVAKANWDANNQSPLSLLTKTFNYKANWSTGTRRIEVVDEEALKELFRS